VHDFRRLRVWQEAAELAITVYRQTRALPQEEKFGLRSQIRSAAISVSSNIAEGAGRGGGREMARFLRVAMGSLAELDSQMEVAVRLGLITPDPELSDGIQRLGAGLIGLHETVLSAAESA
jgi:four helix bundle protein